MRVFVPSMRSSPAVRPTPDTPQQEAAWRERPTPLQVDASDWTVTDLTCSHEVLLPSRQTRKLSFPAGALNLVARKSKQLPTSSDSRQKQQKLQKKRLRPLQLQSTAGSPRRSVGAAAPAPRKTLQQAHRLRSGRNRVRRARQDDAHNADISPRLVRPSSSRGRKGQGEHGSEAAKNPSLHGSRT